LDLHFDAFQTDLFSLKSDHCRSDGIDILLAKYPWADCVDAEYS